MTSGLACITGPRARLSGSVPSLFGKLPLALLALLAASGLCSCLAVPIPQDHVYGRVANTDPLTIKTGVTTQEDILLRLGDPDVVVADERVFVYEWEHVKWGVLWIVPVPNGTGGLIEVPTHEMLLIQFDQSGRVQRADHTVRPRDVEFGEFLKNWAKGGTGAKP
jgi:outer membrane protein assembly factor BamE (lipoprotein component of BamABCDE complex)